MSDNKNLEINHNYILNAISDIRELASEFEEEYKDGEDSVDYDRWKSLEHAIEVLKSVSGERIPNPNIDINDIRLVLAAITGDIYLADIEEAGIMNTFYRRVATKDVQIAMAEWFIKNDKNEISFPEHGTLKWEPIKNEDN